MISASVTSIAAIVDFFGSEAKQIRRGENSYASDRVESFVYMYDGTLN